MAELPWTSAPGGLVMDGLALLKARVRAAAHDGMAKAASCSLLADAWHITPRQVSLAAGATARIKRIRVAAMRHGSAPSSRKSS
jgi:uncharacterized protein YggU (UPF0235/DUF167 family)